MVRRYYDGAVVGESKTTRKLLCLFVSPFQKTCILNRQVLIFHLKSKLTVFFNVCALNVHKNFSTKKIISYAF